MGSAYQFHSWRVFVLVCAFPSVFAIGALTTQPESPRFFLEVSGLLQWAGRGWTCWLWGWCPDCFLLHVPITRGRRGWGGGDLVSFAFKCVSRGLWRDRKTCSSMGGLSFCRDPPPPLHLPSSHTWLWQIRMSPPTTYLTCPSS